MCRSRGRPRAKADVDDILKLRCLHYEWTKIASILGISRATLYRRLEEEGISPNDYTPLTDDQLDEVVISIKHDHPNDGEVLLKGHLLRQGIRVSRQALRNAIHRVDHENTVARRHTAIRRRIYSVPYPNYIWHIDSHHKLIRWRIITHGAVDGYSRCITYLKSSDNNRACTVQGIFCEGVSRFGLPDHIRSDHGGENIDVWRSMIASHDFDYTCVITGSSVHNERIERMWRDVHRCVTSIFTDVFRKMEQDQVLDPLNEVDLYCLHYIYLPRINRSISEFQESWNNHGLSSEGAMSPHQLHFEGMNCLVQNCDSFTGSTQINNMSDVETSQVDRVSVPRIIFIPCTALEQNLRSSISPLELTPDHGRTLYNQTIQIVGQHLAPGCDQCIV